MAEVTDRHCILVGNWNPAILSPQWVADKIFQEKAVKTQVDFAAAFPPAIGAPFAPTRFVAKGVLWLPTNNRLEVHAKEPAVDPGDFASKVLELLPHTPIRAVGNNLAIRLEGTLVHRFRELCRSELQQRLVSEQHGLVGFQAVVRLAHRDDAVLSVSFDQGGPEPPALRFNFHRDVKDAAAAAAATRCFRTDESEANRLFDQILKGVAH